MNLDNIWCWIIPLLVGAICALLGYLLGKGNSKTEVIDNTEELNSWKSKNGKLQADLDAANAKLNATANTPVVDHSAALKALETENAKLKTDLDLCQGKLKSAASTNVVSSLAAGAVTGLAFNAADAKAAYGKKIKQDDLKIVEGIGPKIEGLFHNFGIKTWKELSETPIEKCQEVLNSGGERYRIHNPGSWPLQAKMAYEGKWIELVKWQDEHKGGKL
ncbi:hypothetical protein [Croceivirga sp. JEA036]|uniref:hypothetical protein n=1 Tax=Croceivirga sp. JEA036 TaxID=2721162 RepID=UPI00143C5403|nr:hypothetical protein [Croceivirga sp. JEA036]NJB36929.1 hypothetical protein [Croceivirga sp. JEA036]